MNSISTKELNELQAHLQMRYPALVPVLTRCRNPARDTQILDRALVYEESYEEIATDLGVSRTIVTHVVRAARRYLVVCALLHQNADASGLELTTCLNSSDSLAMQACSVGCIGESDGAANEHVESQLLGLILGYVPPVTAIRRHLARHLVRCADCRIALGTLIAAISEETGRP
jgi:hypothetical protein